MEEGISRDDVSTLRERTNAEQISEGQKKMTFKERLPVLIPFFMSMLMLVALFWCATSWLFGKVYKQGDYLSNLHILVVDFDGGNIGTALTTAVSSLTGNNTQLSFDIPSDLSSYTYDSVYSTVRAGNHIWGAMVANSGASTNLSAAISSGDMSLYNASSAITLIYNEAHYAAIEAGSIFSNLVAAASATIVVYQKRFGAAMVRELVEGNTSALANAAELLLQPVGYETVNIQKFDFGARVLVNTVGMVFPALCGFFFVLSMNGISSEAGIWARWSILENWIIRASFGELYTFLFSLSWSGWLYAFKESGDLRAGQFFLIWMTLWLTSSIHFHIIETVNALLPMKFMPFFVLSWVIIQVSTTVGPNDLAPSFYKIDYFFPAYHAWGILMTIFGKGANNHLKINLPTLFGWLIVAASLGVYGNWRRCTQFRMAMGNARERVEDEESGDAKKI